MSTAKAERLYETFHSHGPSDIGEFSRGFKIPREGLDVGDAKVMYYTSDKLNPSTGEDEGHVTYYHDHKPDVKMVVFDESRGGDLVKIPQWICNTPALCLLGECDGFDYTDHEGELRSAKAKGRKPEWYCVPSGKALLVIQDKKKVLAVLWGGKLAVEWRGVVG